MPRKIISVITVNNVLTALCNDGTVWQWDAQWTQLPAIPQGSSDPLHDGAAGLNVDCIHGDDAQDKPSEDDTGLGDQAG
jgi:hypothetical protein